MNNTDINHLRQLLCLPDTPSHRSVVCAACLDDMMWDMASATIPGLKAWADRQCKIAEALALHATRHDEGVDYDSARFALKDLNFADLRGADLSFADLSDADLSDADLTEAYLRGANLSFADLREADLRGADLTGAYLREADLRGADLRGAYLRGAKYNQHTQLPESIDPVSRGMVEESE